GQSSRSGHFPHLGFSSTQISSACLLSSSTNAGPLAFGTKCSIVPRRLSRLSDSPSRTPSRRSTRIVGPSSGMACPPRPCCVRPLPGGPLADDGVQQVFGHAPGFGFGDVKPLLQRREDVIEHLLLVHGRRHGRIPPWSSPGVREQESGVSTAFQGGWRF